MFILLHDVSVPWARVEIIAVLAIRILTSNQLNHVKEVLVSLKGSVDEYKRQLEAKYGSRRRGEFTKEWPTVSRYFEAVIKRLDDTYDIEKVLAVGGTGIVHLGQHKRFHQPIVLKINRPNIDAETISMVENEANLLPTLTHPNIISVLDLGYFSGQQDKLEDVPKLTYLVEPFITGSKPFFTFDKDHVEETWLFQTISELRSQMPDALSLAGDDDAGQARALISSLLGDVAALFSQWVSLLSHIHSPHASAEFGYVYLDVKPENVLVDGHLHLTSIDYGSVEHLDPMDRSPVEVFFTERYAHRELIKRKKEKASSNRVRGALKRSELTRAFDYFALGMSMLEVLNEIATIRPHVVPQLPLYRSLHFLATRLLDGANSGKSDDNLYQYAAQIFPGLHDDDYKNLRYDSLADTERDLEKERGRWNLEDRVPELATYSKDIVRVVPGFNTVLTPRLRGVIEHPLVARLKHVTQLGLVSLVYPTADHSRYDHALGSYTYTTYYLKSLFNDLGNPIFRNLVGTEDINAVLLAALLHDLGQYPLAHDLEEVHDRIFKHGRVGTSLLQDPMQDQRGRTLLDIIADPQNGWGVQPETLRRILGAHSKNLDLTVEERKASLKTDVLAALVDGPVDADKADYIIRDSARCELPYGNQLDMERLLRVLTVAIIPGETKAARRVTLGVYDKGLTSAHAIGQARYQLLSTVYWHHTVRITKTMLQYATAMGLPRDVFGAETVDRERIEVEIRERLLAFVKSLVPPFAVSRDVALHDGKLPEPASVDLAAEPPEEVLDSLVMEDAVEPDQRASKGAEWYPGISWTDWLMLQWIRCLPEGDVRSRSLIRGLETRHLYKRIATFARGGANTNIIRGLDDLSWPDKVDLCVKLSKKISDRVKRDWSNVNTATSLSETEFDKLCETHLLVLIDVPLPSKKIGYDRPLGVVPELREKSYYQDTRQAFEDTSWRDIMGAMITGIAPVRILCHPDVRNLVSALYAPVGPWMAEELESLL
jgi:serine/threonine protein kinase